MLGIKFLRDIFGEAVALDLGSHKGQRNSA